MSEIENIKQFALLEEFETSNKLIKLGLGELQNINLNNDFHFLPFQLLSQGFERFMKTYICIGYFHIHQKLPNAQYFRSLGHDLEKLLKEITDNYYFDFDNAQFDLDNEFILTNSDLKELTYILSEFGKLARYHNFDLITGNTRIGVNAKKLWEEFENKLLDKNDYKKLMDFDLNFEVYQKISNHIVIIFEKLVSALSRQFMFNCLGKKGLQLSASTVFDFGMLYHKDFGNRDYRNLTTRYQQAPKKEYKRTEIDELQRNTNPNYKSIKINKADYNGIWPFYVDEVIIECIENHLCIVTIDNLDFALNGAASGRYKLEYPHEAGRAILGKSISNFIEIALNLNKR
ncbi:hypothetical protein [Tenacibaculum finnmarkense]|uniref:hypothetical protein n=1 Tax=Tenacibaculum finnmarkense TaxID=2781243 RepID=UPI000C4B3159|nr:hypothetical protein [Tenacibaculum finnmarkense]MCD8439002.1 hypothetical protein [Tenacibaculum finnmarkense genomovar ulcerans]MCG8719958.1 hypothetical protein [Tenacibaculum finnmarkense]SOS55722.1 conserved hypothetical protein [Tenacibaculum finnmarkense]